MKSLSLSEQDIDDISRAVETEVGSQYREKDPVAYSKMLGAVVDTVTNRAVAKGKSVRSVLNERSQFSAINGPKPKNNSYKVHGSVQNAPKAPAATRSYVEQHLAERAMGKPSLIGGAVDYANIAAVDPANKKPNSWSQKMARETQTVRLGVAGLGTHTHGLAPDAEGVPNKAAPEYGLSLPKNVMERAALSGPLQRQQPSYPSNLAYSKPPTGLPLNGPVPVDPADARAIAQARTRMPTTNARVANIPASAPRLASPVANALTGPARPQNAAAAIDRMLSAPKTAPARAPSVAAYSAVPASARVANAPQRVSSVAPVSATVSTARPAAVANAPRSAAVANNPTPIKGIDITPAAPRTAPAVTSPMAERGRRVAPTNALSAAQAANLTSRLDAAAPRVASVPSAPQPSRVASALSTIGRAIGPSPAAAATIPGALNASVSNSARVANVPNVSRPANVSTSPVAARVSQTTAPAPKVSAAMPANVPSTAKPAAIADTSRRLSPTFSNTVDMQGWSADQKQRTIASLTDPANAGYLSRPKPTMGPNLPQGPQLPVGRPVATAALAAAPKTPAALASLPAPRDVPSRKVAGVPHDTTPVGLNMDRVAAPPMGTLAPKVATRVMSPTMANRVAPAPVTRQPVARQPVTARPAPAISPARAVPSSAPRLGAPSIPDAPGVMGQARARAGALTGGLIGGVLGGPLGMVAGGYLGNSIQNGRLSGGPQMSDAARTAIDDGIFDGFAYGPARPAPAVTPARAISPSLASAPRLGAPSIPGVPSQPGMLGRVGNFISNNAPRAFGAMIGGVALGPVGGLMGGYLGGRLANGPAMSNAARSAMNAGSFDGFGHGPAQGGNVGGLGGLGGMSSGGGSRGIGPGGSGPRDPGGRSSLSGSSFGGDKSASSTNNNSSKSSGSKSSGGKKK